MWQTPKTNWAAADEFRLEPDYERIRGNLEHLQAWAARIARRAELTPMPGERVDGLPYPEFFNRVEQNLAAVAAAAMAVFEYFARRRKMSWLDNFSMAGSMLVGMAAAVLLGLAV